MSNPTQQDIQRNTLAIERFTSALEKSTGIKTSGYNTNRGNPSDSGINGLKNLNKNNGFVNQFMESMRKAAASAKGVGDIYAKLEKDTRHQNETIRSLNKVLADFMAKSKDAAAGLQKLQTISDNTKKAFSSYKENLDKSADAIKKYNEIAASRAIKEKQVIAAQDEMIKSQKAYNDVKAKKKNSADAQAAAAKALKNLNELSAELGLVNSMYEKSKKEMGSLSEAVDELEKFATMTGVLNKEQIDYLKNFKDVNTNSEEFAKIMEKLGDATKGFDDGIKDVTNVLHERTKQMDEAFGSFKTNMKKAALELITKAPAVAFGDFMAQLKNNVNQSDYSNDLSMGMSETERSNTIGENRIGLRVLGGGDEQKGFATGGKTLQTAANQYGVTGAAAVQLGLKYQDSLMNSGFGGKASDTADQMTVMHNFARDLGITDEQLKDFTDNIQESGRMAQLQAKYANLNDQDRRKAINQEIKDRIALSTQLGISLDRQKQLNQESINKQYGGVAQAIMSNIGAKREVSQYNSDNPNSQLSATQGAAYSKGQSQGYDSLNDQEKVDWDTARKQISGNRSAQLSKAASGSASQFYAASVKYVDTQRPFNPDMQSQDAINNNEALRAKSLNGTKVVENRPYAESQKNIVNQTNNAFLDLTKSMQQLNQEMINGAQILHGAGANPAGAAATTAASAVGSFGGSLLGSAIGGGGAAMEVGAAGMVAGIIPVVLGVLAAAAVGAAIGSIASHFLEGTKAGNAIGSGFAHAAAYVGSDEAQQAIDNNNKAELSSKATDARMDELNKVTSAQKAAVLAKGSGDEAGAGQIAEQLRANYKAKYGVDLTGKGVGYSAPGSLNSMMKTDDAQANQAQNDAKVAQDKMNGNMDKLVKIGQEHLDLTKKADQKEEQKDKGSTWQMYNDHIKQNIAGISRKP